MWDDILKGPQQGAPMRPYGDDFSQGESPYDKGFDIDAENARKQALLEAMNDLGPAGMSLSMAGQTGGMEAPQNTGAMPLQSLMEMATQRQPLQQKQQANMPAYLQSLMGSFQ